MFLFILRCFATAFHFVVDIYGTRASDGISYFINGVMVHPLWSPGGVHKFKPGTDILKKDQTFYPVWI